MKYATRATRIPLKIVEVTIGDDTFRLQEINGLVRDKYEIAVVKRITINGTVETEIERLLLKSRLIVQCWIDESGARVYQDGEEELFAIEYPASVVNTLFEAAQKLCGMDAVAVEDAKKNSPSGHPAASISA